MRFLKGDIIEFWDWILERLDTFAEFNADKIESLMNKISDWRMEIHYWYISSVFNKKENKHFRTDLDVIKENISKREKVENNKEVISDDSFKAEVSIESITKENLTVDNASEISQENIEESALFYNSDNSDDIGKEKPQVLQKQLKNNRKL